MKFKVEELRGYGLQWAVAQSYCKDPKPEKRYYAMDFLREQGVSVGYATGHVCNPVARFEGHELEGERWVETGLQLYVKVKLGDVIELPNEVLYYAKPVSREFNPSNVENLLPVEDLLRNKVNPDRFSLSYWGMDRECGFAGCAVGWATTLPELNAKGFRMEEAPEFGKFKGWDAVEEFFGLTDEEAHYLFDGEMYPVKGVLPIMVADRIKNFVLGETV